MIAFNSAVKKSLEDLRSMFSSSVTVNNSNVKIQGKDFGIDIFQPERYENHFTYYIFFDDEVGFFMKDFAFSVGGKEALESWLYARDKYSPERYMQKYFESCLSWIVEFFNSHQKKIFCDIKSWYMIALEISYEEYKDVLPVRARKEYEHGLALYKQKFENA